MKKNTNYRLLALGLLLVSATTLISRFIMPLSDFVDGCIKGLGIGIMLVSIYRMKKYKAAC